MYIHDVILFEEFEDTKGVIRRTDITMATGLTLEGKEVALWLLTSLCTSAKREVEVAL
jgi:hypothetical protein